MKGLRRILGYVKAEYRLVAISIVCALLVASLFSLSLAAVWPLLKVMIGEEGLHGWVNRAIVRHRVGIEFHDAPARDYLDQTGLTGVAPLRISRIRRGGAAQGQGLAEQDVLTRVSWADGSLDDSPRRNVLLQRLAHAPLGQPVTLHVRREDGATAQVPLNLRTGPVWMRLADWLLAFIPQPEDFTSARARSEFTHKSILLIIIVMMVATVLRCTLRFTQEYLVDRISLRTLMRLRKDAYANAVRLPLIHFTSEGVSDTMSRFVQDSNRVHSGITTLLGKVLREPFTMVFLAVCALGINSRLTLVVAVGAPAAGFAINRLGHQMKRATRRTLEQWSRLLSRLQETLQGIRVVKGYHQEEQEERSFGQVSQRLLQQQYRVAKIEAASGPLLEALGMLAAGVGMMVAASFMVGGGMSTSDFFTLVVLLGALAESGRKLGDVMPRLHAANAAADRMFFLIDTPAERDPPDARPMGRLSRWLELRQVTFRYPGTTTPALREIDLKVAAGETVAFVGPNGSGKTTLVSLIPRFLTPTEGRVLIDGQDTAQATLASLREQIGIVTQQTIMFNTSVTANIAYAKPHAAREEIVTAAQRAYAHEFIEQLPKGYDTLVGEQGAKLSGGQLQRLAIARAILRDPALLIFDEATSQIDAESEAKIQKAILEFTRGRTSFIIAHRLSTVINADRIVVLHQGRIVGQGRHADLLESCPLYRKLYQTQLVSALPEE